MPREVTETNVPAKPIKIGEVVPAKVMRIEVGQLSEFVDSKTLENWKNIKPTDEVFQVYFECGDESQFKKIFTQSSAPASNLQLLQAKYGQLVKGLNVSTIRNKDGFLELIL